ncbi:MAG: hypothetical protein M3139_06205 [Bacteroidota bacterium]|nr:hypothetical protein [Bacteroidota bacterium]
MSAAKTPVINCHAHIFTGDHVPPYIAKTFLPLKLYLLLPLPALVKFCRWWYKYPGTIRYKFWF